MKKHGKLKIFFFLFGLYVIFPNFSSAEPISYKEVPLEEWRIPNDDELIKGFDWPPNMELKEMKELTNGNGEFNGDKKADEVKIMLKKDGTSMGLMVIFSSKNNNQTGVLLNSMPPNWLGGMGLSVVKPGKHEIWCIDVEPCDEHGNTKISLETDSISYFKMGSASSIFIWNKEKSHFVRIWTSD